jgi:hypothetical protein
VLWAILTIFLEWRGQNLPIGNTLLFTLPFALASLAIPEKPWLSSKPSTPNPAGSHQS